MAKKSSYRATMTLKQCVWNTANRGRLTPEELDDKIDYSPSSLKRAGIEGPAGAGFNLLKLIPMMEAQDDYSILEHLNHRCGFLMIPIPKGGKSKKERVTDLAEYQRLSAAAVQVLVKLIDGGASREEALDTLYQMLKGTAVMIEEVKAGSQISMDL